jgi:hypothetical protein
MAVLTTALELSRRIRLANNAEEQVLEVVVHIELLRVATKKGFQINTPRLLHGCSILIIRTPGGDVILPETGTPLIIYSYSAGH